MQAKITLNGKEYTMRASAILPRMYRYKFGRDMIKDMGELNKKYAAATKDMTEATEEEKNEARLSVTDLTIFENVAWLMLKLGGEDVGDSPDEWLDNLDGVFSVYEILPTVFDLWSYNTQTTSKPKKK